MTRQETPDSYKNKIDEFLESTWDKLNNVPMKDLLMQHEENGRQWKLLREKIISEFTLSSKVREYCDSKFLEYMKRVEDIGKSSDEDEV